MSPKQSPKQSVKVSPKKSSNSSSKAARKRRPTQPVTPSPSEAACIPTIRRVMRPQDTNMMGFIFGGAILSEIDLAAAIEAQKHHPGNLVTVAMDKIVFKKPIFVGDLISIYTETLRTGSSSVDVKVWVWAQRRGRIDEVVPVTEAHVTMVAVDEHFRSVPLGTPA